jgi:hypothetical protein
LRWSLMNRGIVGFGISIITRTWAGVIRLWILPW